jgi:hypothetical protein
MRVQFPCLYLPVSLSVAALTVLAWRPVSLVKNSARQLNRRFLGRGQTTRSRRPHAGGRFTNSPMPMCNACQRRPDHTREARGGGHAHAWEGEGGKGREGSTGNA